MFKILKTRKSADRFVLLLSTAMPGLQKILTLVFIGASSDVQSIGEYVNDTFIIQILSMFSAFSWTGILLVDINKYPENLRPKFFAKIMHFSMRNLIVLVPVIVMLSYMNLIVNMWGSVLFLFFFSFYQLCRHYYLAHHCYWQIIISDLFVIIGTYILIIHGTGADFSEILLAGISFIFPVMLFYLRNKIPILCYKKLYHNKLNWNFQRRAIQSGVSNVSTGSLPLLIAPLSFQLLSKEYTAVIGYFSYIATFMILIPRAISMHQIPLLSKISRNANLLKIAYRKYEKHVFIALSILLSFTTILYLAFIFLNHAYFFVSSFQRPYLYTICFLMLVAGLFSQIVLPVSNLVMILRQENQLMKVNVIALISVFSFLLITNRFIGSAIIIVISFQIAQIFQHVCRFYILRSNKLLG